MARLFVMLWLSRALLILLATAVLRASPVFAQELFGKPIVGVEIEGEASTLITPAELALPVNATFSRQLVRELVQRLIASGRWTDVQIDAVEASGEGAQGVPTVAGVRLLLRLEARATLIRFDVRGVEALGSADITRELDVQPGAQISIEGVTQLEAQIHAIYEAHGYRQTEVQIAIRDTDDPTSKVLLIEITEGAPTRIGRLSIVGDPPLAPHALLSALPFKRGDVLDRVKVLEGVRRAERKLRRAGYLEATLQEPVFRVISDTSAEITITSHVGPLYSVEIRGQAPLERHVVLDAMHLGEEPLTSRVHVAAVSERIVDTYRRRGFVDSRAEIRRVADVHPGRAKLVVSVVPGVQLDVVAIGFPGARHFDRAFLEGQIASYLEEELPGGGLFAPVDSDVIDNAQLGPGPNQRTNALPPHADPARTFYEPTYASAIEHLQQLYQAEGFLSARVGPAQLQRTSDHRAVVAVPITEGPRTMLHALSLIGNEALGSQELATESGFKRGMPFSYLALEEARLHILQVYKERGYLYAKIEPTVRFSQDRTRAEVTIEIVERYQVQVDSIVIRGATRTDEDLIRDLVELRPGDVYRPSIAQESEERLLGLGVFSGVTISPEDAELPARSKRIEVSVTQRPSQVIDLKVGVSTGQGVRGGFEYGYRDLFGQAISLTLRTELAYQFIFFQKEIQERYSRLDVQDRLERNVTLSLLIPQAIRGSGVRTTFDLYHVRDNQRDYGLDKNGFGLGLNYPAARRLTLSLNGDLENNNIDLFVDAANLQALAACLAMSDDPRDRAQALQIQRQRVPDGNSVLISGRFGINYDHRDNPFSPTRGYYASIASEIARTLKTEDAKINSQFLKVSVTGNGYIPLGHNFVIALQMRAGYILHLLPRCADNPGVECSQTYPNRAFFMGGIDTMRGYYQDAMVPQDQIATITAAANSQPDGESCDPNNPNPTDPQPNEPAVDANAFVRSGDAFVLYRAELRFPIVGDLHGAVFSDLGNLWSNPKALDPFQVRTSVGAGIRLATPVGPLAFDYGIVVGAREALGEPQYGTVHFSMGLF